MGQMRFLAPRRDRLPAGAGERAYLAGMEGIPWQSFNNWKGNNLVISRSISESGNLYIPWAVPEKGEFVLSTASLMERDEPYHLNVELARGTLNRVRAQAADSEILGFAVSAPFQQQLKAATSSFIRAATSQADPIKAADAADESICQAFGAMALHGAEFSRQMLALRHRQEQQLPTLLAGTVNSKPLDPQVAELFEAAFNSVSIPLTWQDVEPSSGRFDWNAFDRQVQWAHQRKLKILAGPLLMLEKVSLPDWLYLWEDDFEALQGCVTQYITATVQRYRGRVHVWNCAARINSASGLSLSEEQKLRLAVGGIEKVRQLDARTPAIISFDQPWAEYLASEDLDLSPMHFADALVRAELGVAGIGLEINLGYWPGGTQPRDPVEFARQIDRWSLLGLPLVIFLTLPSSSQADPLARNRAEPIEGLSPGGPTPQWQKSTTEQLVPLLLAKPHVHAVVWNQLSDAEPHEFAHAGLLDAQQRPKPLLHALERLRREHLA